MASFQEFFNICLVVKLSLMGFGTKTFQQKPLNYSGQILLHDHTTENTVFPWYLDVYDLEPQIIKKGHQNILLKLLF